MNTSFPLATLCLLLFAHVAAGQAQVREYRNIKPQAEAVMRATLAGDFEKLVDLTHPRVVGMVGGREKMLAELRRQMEQEKAQGKSFGGITASVGEPGEVVSVGKRLFSVVPTEMKFPAESRGVLVMKTFVIGVSDDGSDDWKFLTVPNRALFKLIFPEAADKLNVPDSKPMALEPAP
jgi:hypothetical protein